MGHDCSQAEQIKSLANEDKTIKQMITVVQCDLEEHRLAQQETDKEREKHRLAQQRHDEAIDKKLNHIVTQQADLSTQIREVLDLNKEVKDFKTAWRVGKNIGKGLAAFIIFAGIIAGGWAAFKEILKH